MTLPTLNSEAAGRLPAMLQEAIRAHEAGELAAARPLYREFLSKEPGHATALQLFGLLHSQCGEYDAAIRLMSESLRLSPEQAEVANNLGNALSGAGRLREAVDSYARAVRLNPRFVDAFRNLGLCYLQLGVVDDARTCFERCVQMEPDDPAAWLGLGNACKRLGNIQKAMSCFEKALELRPEFAEAHHNLGICLRLTLRADEALTHYQAARRLGLDRAELYQNVGSAQVDLLDVNGAIDSYREAIRRAPEDLVSHRNLNKLLWEQERLDDYLESYGVALARHPQSIPLRVEYALALRQQERFHEAEKILMEGLRAAPDSSALKSQLGFVYEAEGRWLDSLQMHAAAVALPDSSPHQRVSYVRALLACRRPDQALGEAEQAIAQIPFDQRAIAYLGLCWRMLGDARDAALNDYEGFVRAYDIPVPRDYGNAVEFNRQLGRVLDGLHVSKRHPPEQTLRGGTQTLGDLFDRREPEITGLVDGLSQCIREYIAALPDHRSHPLLTRRRRDFAYTASWSVRLAPCGYHTMHVHPLGWISSAYYVQVPAEIRDTDVHGGGIKFGEPDIDLGTEGTARRQIQPLTGRLVLFPSYMWHGTVPFEAGSERTTVAFDVIPRA